MSDRFALPTAGTTETRRAVLDLLRPVRGRVAITMLVLIAGTVAGLLNPPIIGYIVDLVTDGKSADSITAPVIALVVLALAQAALVTLGTSMVAALGESVLASLRERVIARVFALPLDRVERAGTGDVLARVGQDVSVVADAIRRALPALSAAGLTILLTVVGLAALDWRLAVAGLAAVPVQLFAVRFYARNAPDVYASERVANAEMTHQLHDSIEGVGTVRAYRLGPRHVGELRERSGRVVTLTMRAMRLQTLFFTRLNLGELVGLAAVLTTGFFLARDELITVGAVTAAALYFQRLFDPLNELLGLADEAQAGAASLARLVGVANLPEPESPVGGEIPADGPAAVELHEVGHEYTAGRPVLEQITLTVADGEHVALVGASGAGKSTLAKLIAGVHEPTAGSLGLGGVPIEQLDPAELRRSVVLVTQEVHVFAGTIAEDLRMALPDATDDQLESALERVGAIDWVRASSDGLATVVGDGGRRLDATQAQQLALARLDLADPRVAVLDEATAEAGSAGARRLEAASEAVLRHRTAIVVAHRLTQAARADRIVVMEHGRIAEVGTHADLVERGGAYAALWAGWSSGRLPPPAEES